LLRGAGVRQQVTILWNANNVFGFEHIDWGRLAEVAVITTVSRYMKHYMKRLGVEALAIPNGLAADTFVPPGQCAVGELRHRFRHRTVVTKVARWDPDKRWLLAIDSVSAMKRQGWRPLLIARGGMEAHGAEVLQAAVNAGLQVVERTAPRAGVRSFLQALE